MSPDLLETLTWLSGLGSAVAGAALISLLAEYWLWFQKLPADAKLLFQVAASAAIALAAFLVVTFVPAEVLAQIAPYWRILFGAVVAALGNQLWHKATKD